jgi:hypothetical protein
MVKLGAGTGRSWWCTPTRPGWSGRAGGGSACVLPDPPVSLSVTVGQGADAPGSRILLRPDPLDDLRLASILRLWTAQGLQALGRQRPSRSTVLEPRRHPGIRSGRGSRSPLAPCPATGFTAMGDGSCSMQLDEDARATVVPGAPVGGQMSAVGLLAVTGSAWPVVSSFRRFSIVVGA